MSDQPIRIVVVDDHTLFRRGMTALLGGVPGFAIVGEAADGLEGIRVVAALQPDVVLLDLNMPGISGKEVVRFLRSLGLNRDAPIHAYTASGSYSVAEAREQGFDGVLTKPLDSRRLIELVYAAKQAKAA